MWQKVSSKEKVVVRKKYVPDYHFFLHDRFPLLEKYLYKIYG